jgi:hypothetical protein
MFLCPLTHNGIIIRQEARTRLVVNILLRIRRGRTIEIDSNTNTRVLSGQWFVCFTLVMRLVVAALMRPRVAM